MFPSEATFHRIQNKSVVPVVADYWENLKATAAEDKILVFNGTPTQKKIRDHAL
jgi:hypothetical protein